MTYGTHDVTPHTQLPSSGPLGDFDLRWLKTIDRALKPSDWHSDWETQTNLFQGRGRSAVQACLRDMKLGIRDDRYPFEADILRNAIEQLSVVYRSEPVRRLLDPSEEVMAEEEEDHRTLLREYRRSRVHAFLRHMERMRSLWRQCIIRVYPSKTGRVRLSIFPPTAALRDPDLGEPDDLRCDKRFALKLADSRWEFWESSQDGWRMKLLDHEGLPLAPSVQPYGESGLSPYEHLPVLIAFDGFSAGPWIGPKTTRTAYPLKIAVLFNEIMSQVKWSSHPTRVNEQPEDIPKPVESKHMPRVSGPGVSETLPPGITAKLLTTKPELDGALAAIDKAHELFLRSESLPTDSYSRSQDVSALGMKQQMQPLIERQESLRPYALEVEHRLFDAFWAVHRLHADDWGQDTLSEDLGLEVEFGPIDIPQDSLQLSQVSARDMALGLISRVDAVMQRENCSREDAIRRIARVDEDRERFGIYNAEISEEEEGQHLANPNPEEPGNPAGSVVASVREVMAQNEDR